MPKRVETGIVTSDKTAKTRRVEIPRLVRHPRYGKYVRRKTICYVHDENNESHMGDLVEIIESRPMSRTKLNPVGFRTGIMIGWKSRWYASKQEFAHLLVEDQKIRHYVKGRKESFGKLLIWRFPD